MTDKLSQEKLDAEAEAYLNELLSRALGGDIEAGDTLSKIALGGCKRARDLVDEMDGRRSNKIGVSLEDTDQETISGLGR